VLTKKVPSNGGSLNRAGSTERRRPKQRARKQHSAWIGRDRRQAALKRSAFFCRSSIPNWRARSPRAQKNIYREMVKPPWSFPLAGFIFRNCSALDGVQTAAAVLVKLCCQMARSRTNFVRYWAKMSLRGD